MSGHEPGISPESVATPELHEILAAGGPELAVLLERTEARLAEIALTAGPDGAGGSPGELARNAHRTLVAGGKRLRPVLVFLCAAEPAGEMLVRAAAAVELVHMAALLHDDVLDRAPLRRGRPTVFATDGRAAAIAAGDFLFARAFAELAQTGSVEAVRSLSAAASALVRGELMQREDTWSSDLTPERYLERCTLKTASLFAAACRLGALLGGAEERASALATYGSHAGLAFQIFDDVLDVAGVPDQTGKRRGADLLDGTVTLPLILARRLDDGLAHLDLHSIAEPATAAEVCERIVASGALEQARRHATMRAEEAKEALREAALPRPQRALLDLVADAVVERRS